MAPGGAAVGLPAVILRGYEIEYGPPERRHTMLVQERSRADQHVTHLEGATMHALVRLDDVREAVRIEPTKGQAPQELPAGPVD